MGQVNVFSQLTEVHPDLRSHALMENFRGGNLAWKILRIEVGNAGHPVTIWKKWQYQYSPSLVPDLPSK